MFTKFFWHNLLFRDAFEIPRHNALRNDKFANYHDLHRMASIYFNKVYITPHHDATYIVANVIKYF